MRQIFALLILSVAVGTTAHGQDITFENHIRPVLDRRCVKCHGETGMGDVEKFYPRINGQHFKYMLRQFEWIRDGKRRNANPEMVEQIKLVETPLILPVAFPEKPKVDDDGATFASTYDGSRHHLTPESAASIQARLGADISMIISSDSILVSISW